MGEPVGRVLGGVVGELQPRLHDLAPVDRDARRRRHRRWRQSWPGIPCALASTSAVSSADMMRSRRITSMRLSARAPISSISPDIRSSSSMAIARVAWVSDGIRRVEQLEVPAHDRDRRLEFVLHVVEQPPLVGQGRIQPVEHVVDGAGQLRDVVVPDDGDARRALRRRDLLGRDPQPADRREQPADRREPDESDDGQRARGDQHVVAEGAVEGRRARRGDRRRGGRRLARRRWRPVPRCTAVRPARSWPCRVARCRRRPRRARGR